MKITALLLYALLSVSSLIAADWPPAFEQYEELAARHVTRGPYLKQLWHYAIQTGREAELRERWEALASGAEEWRYRLMLGRLEEFRVEPGRARAQFQRAVQAAPANAECLLALAALDLREKAPRALEALANALAMNPPAESAQQAYLDLAGEYAQLGETARALATLERGAQAIHEAKPRQRIVQAWYQQALAAGQVFEMFAHLEQAHQDGREDGGALALAYAAAGDPAAAESAMDRALKNKPGDAALREQALLLSPLEPHTPFNLRLLREAAAAAPSPFAQTRLFQALIAIGAAEEVRKLMLEHGAELAATIGLWREAVPAIWKHGLASELRAVLARRPDSWEASLAQAELQIIDRAWADATATLWSLFEPRFEREPHSALTLPVAAEPGPGAPQDLLSGVDLHRRRRGTIDLLERTPAPFAVHAPNAKTSETKAYTLRDARDMALVCLGRIAVETKQTSEFLGRLEQQCARHSLVEQLFAWSVVEAPEPLVEAIARYLASAERTPRCDGFCREQLEIVSGASTVEPALQQRAGAQMAHLAAVRPGERSTRAAVDPKLAERVIRWIEEDGELTNHDLRDRCLNLEVQELSRLVGSRQERLTVVSPNARRGSGGYVRSTAARVTLTPGGRANAPSSADNYPLLKQANAEFIRGEFLSAAEAFAKALESMPNALAPSPARLSADTMSMATWMAKFEKNPAHVALAASTVLHCVILDTLRWPPPMELPSAELFWPQKWPASSYRIAHQAGPGRPVFPSQLSAERKAKFLSPPPGLFPTAQTNVLWCIYSACRKPGLWPVVKAELAEALAKTKPEHALHWRGATCYLTWWIGEWGDAEAKMRQLFAETGDENIRLGLAAMLRQQGKGGEAAALLREMKLPYAAFARLAGTWRLRMAAEAKDAALVASLARELAGQPFERTPLRDLAQTLEKADFAREAEPLRRRAVAGALLEEDTSKMVALLEELEEAKETAATAALARRVLDGSIRAAERNGELAEARRKAWQMLSRAGELEAYAAALQQRTVEAADPVEHRLRIAEASTGRDEAAVAYREVLRLEPGNRTAARALLERNPEKPEELFPVFEALLAAAPDEALANRAESAAAYYLKAKQLPRFAAALAKARISSTGAASREFSEYRWQQLARTAWNAHDHESAATILGKAFEVVDPPSTSLSWDQLLQLEQAGRDDLLGPALLRHVALKRTAPALFTLGPKRDGRGAEVHLDPKMLAMAQRAGVAPQLRALVEKEAGQLPSAKPMLTYLRVLERNPMVLPELRALATDLSPRAGSPSWGLPLIREVAAWPQAAEACLALIEAYASVPARGSAASRVPERIELAKLAQQAGSIELSEKLAREVLTGAASDSGSSGVRGIVIVGELAVALGNAKLLAECGRVFAQRLSLKTPHEAYETADGLRFAGLLLDGDQVEQSAALVAALRGSMRREDATALSRLRSLTAELELRRGELTQASPAAWIEADRSTPERAAVAWDLAVTGAGRVAGPVMVRGQPWPALSGAYYLELLFGETEEALHVLARIPHAEPRGIWQGTLPAPMGFLRAVFSQGDRVSFGPVMPVCAGENLLPRPTPEQPAWGFALDHLQRHQGGPAPEGEYLAYAPVATARESNPLPAGQVKLKPGREYVLSGWLRARGSETLRIVAQYYDKDGKPISHGASVWYVTERRWWSHSVQRLRLPSRLHSGPATIPPNAVFVAPAIERGANGFEVAGLSLVELPAASEKTGE